MHLDTDAFRAETFEDAVAYALIHADYEEVARGRVETRAWRKHDAWHILQQRKIALRCGTALHYEAVEFFELRKSERRLNIRETIIIPQKLCLLVPACSRFVAQFLPDLCHAVRSEHREIFEIPLIVRDDDAAFARRY